MAGVAGRDQAAAFWLYLEFGDHIAAALRRHLRALGADAVPAGDFDGLVLDACLVLYDCGAAWSADGGALPWHWAARRLRTVASTWVGQHASELDAERLDADRRPGPEGYAGAGPSEDEAELDVLARLAGAGDGRCALLLEALERVASERDRAIVVEVRAQAAAGDPSPATTVARHHGVTPEVVRQVVCRVRARLASLVAAEARFAPLAGLPLVA